MWALYTQPNPSTHVQVSDFRLDRTAVKWGMRTRPPAFAGMFYPDKPQELASAVKTYVAAASPPATPTPPKAVVAPHAGYIYSGPIAGTAYAALAARGGHVERVVLLGPSHRVAFTGVATSGAGLFETPMGPVAVDRDAVASLVASGLAREVERAHENEHSLEVQLPFLKQLFPAARVVPLLAGDDDWNAAKRVLADLWGGDETVIVVSSDLSHYHDHTTAKTIDAGTARAMESLAVGNVDHQQACGATGVNALLALAAEKGFACTTLDLRNSGDTAGPKNRVVGYGAFAFSYL
jgi:AmmeMemoRadiSam system protein B